MMTTLQSVAGWLDPDWFQAIGSVVAILAGFAYIALQHWLTRRKELQSQAEMRLHAIELCRSIVDWQIAVLKIFELSHQTGTATMIYHPPRPIMALATELLTMPVTDLGETKLASAARRVGGNAIAFTDVADQAAGSVCSFDILNRMKDLASRTAASANTLGLAR